MSCSDTYGRSFSSPNYTALNGGIAYTNGVQAQFYNPANLMVRANERSFQLTLGLGGLYYSNGVQIDQFYQLPVQLQPHFLPDNLPQNGSYSNSEILQKLGKSDRYHQSRSFDMIPVGFNWIRESSSRSIAFRSRGYSSYELNRNWFESDVSPENEEAVFTRFINEKYQVFHELSFGFAREVTMFNRWHSGLNTLLIGLAPKAVFGGMYSEVSFFSEYAPNGGQWHNTKRLQSHASGDMSRFITDIAQTGQVEQAFQNHVNPGSNIEINGYGLGLDAGLTYIIPLSDDISLSPHIHKPLRRSLRFSIAISDIGMVRFHNSPGKWNSNTTQIYDELPQSGNVFDGQPGEVFHYLQSDSTEASVIESLVKRDTKPFYVQLPTELRLGTAFQYNRIVTMLDFNYRLNSADFEEDGWRASLGTEIRLIRFLPLQGSIQLDSVNNIYLGLGTGLDFGFLNIFAAARLTYNNSFTSLNNWHADTISALGMQIRF